MHAMHWAVAEVLGALPGHHDSPLPAVTCSMCGFGAKVFHDN